MKTHLKVAIASLFLVSTAFSGVASAATYTTLTLPTLNADIRSWSDGGTYSPLFPSSQNLAGVPFNFQLDGNGQTVFNAGSLSIPVNVFGVTNVYTLINTAWGSQDANVGAVTFYGSNGDIYKVDLIEGGNVRDHYYGGFVNTITDPNVTLAVWGPNVPGRAHLDMQDFALPGVFATETLVSMTFDSTGGGAGSPFLAGATVAAVPEPESYALLLSGLGLMGFMMRRRNHGQT